MDELTAHRLAARLRQVEGGRWDVWTGQIDGEDNEWYVSDGTARITQRDLDNVLSGDMPGAHLAALIDQKRNVARGEQLTRALSWIR